MNDLKPRLNLPASLAPWRATAVSLVFAIAALDWVGWATGVQVLTRIHPSWPQMTPWTALWLTGLGAAILVQAGRPPSARIWIGRGVAATVGVLAAVVLVEYATGRLLGVDQVWFPSAVRELQSTWPGRPSPQTAVSTLLLSVSVGLTQVRRRWSGTVSTVTWVVAMAVPGIALLDYLFATVALVKFAASTGMALVTAFCLLLLGAATALAEPERGLAARVLSRPNRQSLFRLGAVIAGFPILVGSSQNAFTALGLSDDAALTLSTTVGTGIVGVIVLFLSEREWRQRAVAESERNVLRANADSMLDPQVLLEAVRDSEGRVVDFRYRSVNNAACRYLGVQSEYLLGHNQLEVLPNLANSDLHGRYIQCLEDGLPVVIDDFAYFNLILNDLRRYEIRATRAGADQISLTWRDITDRVQAAERLAASEMKYRLLADNSSDAITHVRDGKVAWTSPSIVTVLGAPPEHWAGRSIRDVVPPEDAPAFEKRWATLAAGGSVQERIRVMAVDGTLHWVHLHARPFLDAGGCQDGVTAALRLVDDEVAAENAISEARLQRDRADALYRRSVDNAAVGMCLIDPAGGFIEVNDALCEFFGYDADSLKRMTWQELTAPDYLDADLSKVEDLLNGRMDSYRMLKQYVHSCGDLIWGDLSVSCVRDDQGRVEQFISQITDVTPIVQANDRIAQLLAHITAELASAAAYLDSIMPKGLTGLVNVTSRYLPSQELAGDCFDYRWIDDDNLIVYLIDVSGHGIEPALLAISVHNLLRSGALPASTLLAPEKVLHELNRLFEMEQHKDHYFTMWIGSYEASTRTLRYASAGAPPALAFDPGRGDRSATELSTGSPAVGLFRDTEFTSHSYAVPPQCRILLFSDGAYEFPLADGGHMPLSEFMSRSARWAVAARPTLDDLIGELRSRALSGAFSDDCSLLQIDIA